MYIESRGVRRCGVRGILGGMKIKVDVVVVGGSSGLIKDVGVEKSWKMRTVVEGK